MAKRREREQQEQLDEEDPATKYMTPEGLAMLQQHLVSLLMGANDERIAALLLECIALMSKRFVQKDWAGLVPELAQYLQN